MSAEDLQRRQRLLDEIVNSHKPPVARLLSTRDVALLFQVSEHTVINWANKEKLAALRTLGGHRRYPAEAVRTLFLDAHRT